jgi:hypothetical protein
MALLSIETNVDLRTVSAKFSKGSTVIFSKMRAALDRIGGGMVSYIVTQKLRGGVLQYRTGNLGRAIFYRVEDGGGTSGGGLMLVRVGADGNKAIYARIQELGGVVSAKGGALTIPLEAAKTAAGVARFTAQDVRNDPGAYGFKRTFIAKGVIFGVKAGGSFYEGTVGPRYNRRGVGTAVGRAVEYVPLFALKPSVTLKAAGYLSSSFQERQDWIRLQLETGIVEAAQELSA